MSLHQKNTSVCVSEKVQLFRHTIVFKLASKEKGQVQSKEGPYSRENNSIHSERRN